MSQVPVPLRRVQKKLVFSRSTWGWGEGLMIPIWLRGGGGGTKSGKGGFKEPVVCP